MRPHLDDAVVLGDEQRPFGGAVAVDGYTLGLTHGTGIATYTRTLRSALSHLFDDVETLYGRKTVARTPVPPDVQFFDTPGPSRLEHLLRRVPTPPLPRSPARAVRATRLQLGTTVWTGGLASTNEEASVLNVSELYDRARTYFTLYGRLLPVSLPADVRLMHWSHPLPLAAVGIPNVYSVHDLIPLRMPYATEDRTAYYYRLMQQITARADLLLTVSETTRADLNDIFPASIEKSRNVYQTAQVKESFALDADALGQALKGEFGLTRGRYLLFVGAIEPKKNIGRLLEAYQSSNIDMPLVVVGPRGWYSDAIHAELDGHWLRERRGFLGPGRVLRLEYQSSGRLDLLMRGARALLFPSLFEGFGLPILEAFLREVPVMTSAHGAMSEIAGDAAALVDALSVKEMRACIQQLSEDDSYVAELVKRGRARAAHFSMTAYVERLHKAYSTLL